LLLLATVLRAEFGHFGHFGSGGVEELNTFGSGVYYLKIETQLVMRTRIASPLEYLRIARSASDNSAGAD